MTKKFYFKYQKILFNPEIDPYQVLPLQAILDLEAMAMKVYSVGI